MNPDFRQWTLYSPGSITRGVITDKHNTKSVDFWLVRGLGQTTDFVRVKVWSWDAAEGRWTPMEGGMVGETSISKGGEILSLDQARRVWRALTLRGYRPSTIP
jgi:hypothetical protein